MKEKNKALAHFAVLGSLFLAGTVGIGVWFNSCNFEQKNKDKEAIQNVEKRPKWNGYALGGILSAVAIGSVFAREKY